MSMATNVTSLRVKSNAKWICQECGSTEFIQGHHQVPRDDSTIIVLCASCHSKRHPDIPYNLFFNKNNQPYWENISAASLARQLERHPRTIYRVAKKLGIKKGVLSTANLALIRDTVLSEPTKYMFKSKIADNYGECKIVNIYLEVELKNQARKNAIDKKITFRDWLTEAIIQKLQSDGVVIEQDPRTSP